MTVACVCVARRALAPLLSPRHTRLNSAPTRDEMPRILMTGASGGIGTSLRKLLPPIYPDLLLSDLKAPADLGRDEKFKAAELSDPAQVEAICEGVDGMLHFGGYLVEGGGSGAIMPDRARPSRHPC